ncbi:MAG TPA: trypsin-like peptidase domain-containing protein [Acidimicrobiales bacterium]|nr:trypsin-like peptidase domain-containing protein [Acidimicrobiales bacterium]
MLAALVGAVVGALVASGLVLALDDGGEGTARSTAADRPAATLARPGDIRSILAKVEPAVVSISTVGFTSRFFDVFAQEGAGTGMILTPDGDVLTNAHVVAGARTIQVKLDDGRTFDAAVVGSDNTADIALLRLQDASGLPIVEVGRSADLRVGDQVVAIGNALALPGGPTVTTGIVSALDRAIGESARQRLEHLIQTDAAINPGNSGGPLVNVNGQVVGMNTAVIQRTGTAEAQNIGFAIASDTFLPVVDDLRRRGGGQAGAPRAFLGVTTATLQGNAGAVVLEVDPGSPAEGAGLLPDDVIVRVGDERVTSSDDLGAAVRSHDPGDRVEVTWIRGGRQQSATVTLGQRPGG